MYNLKLFCILTCLVILPTGGYCQFNNDAKNNCVDSLGRKIGIWTFYDIENIKYLEIKYSAPDEIEYKNYFTRSGKVIKKYSWSINLVSLNKIREAIKNDFVVDDTTWGSGRSLLLLMIDVESDNYEIRIIKGIHYDFNKELQRVIKKIEKNLIFIYSDECKTPIIIPFAFYISETTP
jgi:hypothetical protein